MKDVNPFLSFGVIMKSKNLFLKYLFIIISNILIYILCNFYFDSYKYVFMLLFSVVLDMFIYYYKGTIKYKFYYDIVCNFIVGLILLLFIKNEYNYMSVLFSLFLSNNVIFMRSRLSEKFFKKFLQYLLIFIYTIVCIFINVFVFILINTVN